MRPQSNPLLVAPVKAVMASAVCLGLLGCTGAGLPPEVEALQPLPSMAADREMQTRLFETDSELQLLNAGTGVLQDMGFVVDESETRLGLVTASKTVDATKSFSDELGDMVTYSVLVALSAGLFGLIDTDGPELPSKQTVRVSLTTSPSTTREGAFQARVVFDRTIYSTTGARMESGTLRSAEVYEAFFDTLTKSVFLEAEHQ